MSDKPLIPDHQRSWLEAGILALLAGAGCTFIAGLIGFGFGEGLRELLTRPDHSNYTPIRRLCTFLWLASSGLIACGFLTAAGVRMGLGRTSLWLTNAVAGSLLVLLLPMVGARFLDRGVADDLIGIYMLVDFAAATGFWLVRLKGAASQKPGFPVILQPSAPLQTTTPIENPGRSGERPGS